MAGWLCFGAVLAVILFWLVPRGRTYDRIFSDEHFLEVAAGMAGVKQGAITLLATEMDPSADPRTLRTSAGMLIFYTIDRTPEGDFSHHVSVSKPGDLTTGAVGRRLTFLAALLVGLPLDRLALGYSQRGVHHAAILLAPSEHEALCARPVLPVCGDGMKELRREIEAAHKTLPWEQIEPLAS